MRRWSLLLLLFALCVVQHTVEWVNATPTTAAPTTATPTKLPTTKTPSRSPTVPTKSPTSYPTIVDNTTFDTAVPATLSIVAFFVVCGVAWVVWGRA